MIGVIRPPGMATATEMSTRSYMTVPSSLQEALAAGTFFKVMAAALMMKSLTESL